MTFKPEAYEEYKKKGNKNLFEEIIDNLMVGELSGKFGPETVKSILESPLKDKRASILSLIDKDFSLFGDIYKKMEGYDLPYPKMNHVNEIIELTRKYVQISAEQRKEVGEVMTPIHLVEEMLDKLPDETWSDPNKTFFDPCNGTGPFLVCIIKRLMRGLEEWEPKEELRYKHIIENQIYACELGSKNMFLYLCTMDPQDKYILNVYCGDFLHDGFDSHNEKIWNMKKFDIIVANPPYSKNLHLKFLDKCVDMANEEVVFVHPSSFLVDKKGSVKIYSDIKNKIRGITKSLKLFNGNGIFNIGLYIPCTITHLDLNKKNDNIILEYPLYGQNIEISSADLDKISIFGYSSEFTSIFNKISENLKFNTNLEDFGNVLGSGQESKRKLCNAENFYVEMSHITAGNNRGPNVKQEDKIHKDDFFIAISKYQLVVKSGTNPRYNIWFEFENATHAENFIKYLTTDFFRMCLALTKTNQNLARGEFRMIPVVDFTRSWTDEELYELFNITEEEQAFIKKVIPKWYDR